MGVPRQWDLFNGPPPKSHHAERLTSEAKMNTCVKLELQKYGNDGATAEQIGDALRILTTQASSALSELHLQGEVRKTEMKRRSRAGGWCSVYLAIARFSN